MAGNSYPTPHDLYMQRCLDLARLGVGYVAPNPMVGCVIVAGDRIIGEGWHRQYGQAHAEVNALESIHPEDRPLLREATLYVNLEPCSHHGNTPPCADRIIREGIPHVVVANTDPDPRVAGNGMEMLKKAGILVTAGILEAEGRVLNRHFFTYHERQRPFITLKWAQSADGYLGKEGERTAISGETALRFTHQLRAGHAAILVGSRTAITDDPALTVRHANGPDPIRVLIDPDLRVTEGSKLFDPKGKAWVFNRHKEATAGHIRYIRVDGDNFLPLILDYLYREKVQSVLVEGGANTLQQFISAGLWDEAYVYGSPLLLGHGVPAPVMDALPDSIHSLGEDKCYSYTHRR